MGRVVKPLAGLEVVLLLAVAGAGLTAFITTLQTMSEIPDNSCLLYTEVNFQPDPPIGWANITFKHCTNDDKCNFCLTTQMMCACLALAGALYRAVTICNEDFDVSLVRVLSIPLYLVAAVFALVESTVLQVGFFRFCENLSAYMGSEEKYKCETSELFIASLPDAPKSQFNFVSEFAIATRASWISLGLWFILTVVTMVSFGAARNKSSAQNIKT